MYLVEKSCKRFLTEYSPIGWYELIAEQFMMKTGAEGTRRRKDLR